MILIHSMTNMGLGPTHEIVVKKSFVIQVYMYERELSVRCVLAS